MTRLTNAIREEVVGKILNKTFEKRLQKLDSEESYLAFEVRDFWLGKDKDAFLKLDPKLQAFRNTFQVNPMRMGKTYDCYDLRFHPSTSIHVFGCASGSASLSTRSNGEEPVGGDRYSQLGRDSMTDDIRAKIIAHIDKVETLQSDVRKLGNKILEQLRACTTIKRLNDLWPEAVSYVPKQDNPIAVIVDRDGVNNLISCMKEGDCPDDTGTAAK